MNSVFMFYFLKKRGVKNPVIEIFVSTLNFELPLLSVPKRKGEISTK